MILGWVLSVAMGAWAQTKLAPVPVMPGIAAPAASLPSLAPLAGPQALAPLPALSVSQPLKTLAPLGASEAGEDRQEAAPPEASDAGPAVGAAPEAEQAAAPLSAAPESPEATAAELLRQVSSRRTRRALAEKIYADPLTGLVKRSYVHDHIRSLLERNTAVMVLDLDHFKKGVNDLHGHDVGDIALSELARILREEASPGRLQVRWGGEEFVILDKLGEEQARAAAERIRLAVQQRLAPALMRQAKAKLGRDVEMKPMTVSIGVAPIPPGSTVFEDLRAAMQRADQQLFAAKSGGRNQVRMADSGQWTGRSRAAAALDWALRRWKAWFKAKDRSAAAEAQELLDSVSDPALRRGLFDKLYTDSLTGLRNRAHLNDFAEDLVSRNRSVLYVDVDRFKGVNDRYGHVRAGEILGRLGIILKEVAGEDSYLVGGEEFLVLSPSGVQGAMREAEELRKAVEARLGPESGIDTLTVSIGVAPLDGERPAKESLKRAMAASDQALYLSKKNGRNRVTLAE